MKNSIIIRICIICIVREVIMIRFTKWCAERTPENNVSYKPENSKVDGYGREVLKRQLMMWGIAFCWSYIVAGTVRNFSWVL